MTARITERVHVSVAPQIKNMIVQLAEEKGISMSAVISLAIDKFYKAEKGGGDERK